MAVDIEILRLLLQVDQTKASKDINKFASTFGDFIDKVENSGNAFQGLTKEIVDSMVTSAKSTKQLQEGIAGIGNQLGMAEADIQNLQRVMIPAILRMKQEAKKMEDTFRGLEKIKPKFEFEIEGIEKAGGDVRELKNLMDRLYDGEDKTVTDMQLMSREIQTQIGLEKKKLQVKNKEEAATSKAKKDLRAISDELEKTQKKAEKLGLSDALGANFESLEKDLSKVVGDIGKKSTKEVADNIDKLRDGLKRLKIDTDDAGNRIQQKFQRDTIVRGSESERRGLSSLAQRAKAEIRTGKGGVDFKRREKLDDNIKKLDAAYVKLENSIRAGTVSLKASERAYTTLKAKSKELTDEFRAQKAVIKQNVDAFQNQRKALYDVQNIAENGIMQFGALTAAIGLMFKDLTDAFLEFEESFNKFRGISFAGDMDELNLKAARFKDQAFEIAGTTKFLGAEIVNAGVEMARLGFSIDDINSSMETIANAAEASGEEMADVGRIVAGVVSGFGLAAKDASKVTDVLTFSANNSAASIKDLGETLKYIGPLARGAGEGFEDNVEVFTEMSAIATILGQNMILASQGGTTMREMLLRLIKTTPEAQAQLDNLKISMTEDGKLKKQSDVLKEISFAMENLTEKQKLASAAIIFGQRASTGMVAVLNEIAQDPYGFEKKMDAVKNKSEGFTQAVKNIAWDGLIAAVREFSSELNKMRII